MAESEQRSCALAAAVSVKGILCTSAGGYLIEQLPDVDPDVVKQVEMNLAKLVEMDGTGNLPTGLLLQVSQSVHYSCVDREATNHSHEYYFQNHRGIRR